MPRLTLVNFQNLFRLRVSDTFAKMKYTGILIFLILASCNESVENNEPSYELVGDMIKVEKFDSTVTDENRYNHNNKVFKVGRTFSYSYEYRDTTGTRKYFQRVGEGWEFVLEEKKDESTVITQEIGVLNGLKPMIDWIPDYNQTLLSYRFNGDGTFNMSGAIENEANNWIHPTRDALFRILELNPFPFVQFPLEAGRTWKWQLDIGSQWGDSRWVEWEGNISNDYSYEIIGKETLETKLGSLDCYIVNALGTSSLGETRLKSWYHEDFGFVRMDYVNIDASTIHFMLERVDEPS